MISYISDIFSKHVLSYLTELGFVRENLVDILAKILFCNHLSTSEYSQDRTNGMIFICFHAVHSSLGQDLIKVSTDLDQLGVILKVYQLG